PLKTVSANTSGSLVSMIEKVSPAVVGIVSFQKSTDFYPVSGESRESGTGSGVIFKKSGDDAYIVTNNHVIEGASKIEVSLEGGKRASAELVGADPLTDLAVLKMDSQYAAAVAEFGDSSQLRIGEQVVAIGNPLGLDLSSTVTQGIISGINRTIPVTTSAGDWELEVIQTDAAINPGNSGGALINSAGQVIGINSLKISENGVEGLGFAIPSADVKPIVEKLMKDGAVKRPYMGVQLQDIQDLLPYIEAGRLSVPTNLKDGIMVASVEAGSPGASAGLQPEDIITEVNEEKVEDSNALRKYLYSETAGGDQIKLTIYRNGQKQTVTLTLGEN
ncbi:MAG TPA: trypsin-like peptidase domain-containing protein, partial [Chondromyces sp.]|nr:trypsin-like peptidase domain-containing protein [Chondromyces sp.]